MSVSRNASCPCGSGKKYKKCCLTQEEKSAAEQRRQAHEADAALVKYLTELDALSNKANDLIRSDQWVAAEQCCRQLQEQFPEETDGDERFSQYYKQKADFAPAQAHAQAALQKAEQHPEKFDPELVADLKEEIAYLDECIQAGCLVD